MDESKSQDDELSRPRLRLHHLFVLTAVVAVLLALHGPQREFTGGKFQPPPLFLTFWLLVSIAHTVLSATAITALGYGAAGYRRGERFFDQPGHWLLVEISLAALLSAVPSLGYRWIGNLSSTTLDGTRMAIALILAGYSLLFLIVARLAVNIYIGKTKCAERRWRFVFYTKALATLLFALAELVVIPTTVHALRTDRREQIPRDASHSCGVALQLALSVPALLGGAATLYYMFVVMRR